MKKPLFYGSIALAIIIIVVVVIRLLSPSNHNLTISVPSPVTSSSGSNLSDGKKRLEVTPDTVQTALKTLARAESFSGTYTFKSYWTGGESDSTLKMWRKSENIRMNISKNNTVKNILVRGDELYIWYDGASGVLSSKLSDSSLSSDVDKFSKLLTYEDIYNIPIEDITDAGYREENSQPCIFVEYKSSDGIYVNQIYVSTDSGLLVSSNISKADTPVYSMTSDISITTPPDDVFTVPST
jgi:hypothetical protein